MRDAPAGPGVAPRLALRLSITPFLTAKLLTIAVVMLAAWQHGAGGFGIPGWDQLRDAFAKWDGQSYLQIATSGYPPNSDPSLNAPAHVWAFMPGYPLLISGLSYVVRDQILSGILISAVCELVALVYVARLVSAERDERSARIAVWVLALVPYGVFLSVLYTESAFLAAAAASLYYMRQQRWVAASLCGALATAVRVTGLALFVAVLAEYLLVRRTRVRADALAMLLIPLPFLMLCLYAGYHAGDFQAFFHIESSPSFHRQLTNPITGLRATWVSATSPGMASNATYIFSVELFWGIAGFIGCVLLWTWRWLGARWDRRGVPWSFALYATVVWFLAVAQPYWLSVGRYEIAMLPLLIVVADVLRASATRAVAVVAVSGGVMCYIATLWGQGAFVG